MRYESRKRRPKPWQCLEAWNIGGYTILMYCMRGEFAQSRISMRKPEAAKTLHASYRAGVVKYMYAYTDVRTHSKLALQNASEWRS